MEAFTPGGASLFFKTVFAVGDDFGGKIFEFLKFEF